MHALKYSGSNLFRLALLVLTAVGSLVAFVAVASAPTGAMEFMGRIVDHSPPSGEKSTGVVAIARVSCSNTFCENGIALWNLAIIAVILLCLGLKVWRWARWGKGVRKQMADHRADPKGAVWFDASLRATTKYKSEALLAKFHAGRASVEEVQVEGARLTAEYEAAMLAADLARYPEA